MTLEIKVGPPQLAVHQGYTVMVSEPDGQILVEGDKGLYFLDTRLISAWSMFADGVPWKLLNGGALSASAARVYYQSADPHGRRDHRGKHPRAHVRPPYRRRHA